MPMRVFPPSVAPPGSPSLSLPLSPPFHPFLQEIGTFSDERWPRLLRFSGPFPHLLLAAGGELDTSSTPRPSLQTRRHRHVGAHLLRGLRRVSQAHEHKAQLAGDLRVHAQYSAHHRPAAGPSPRRPALQHASDSGSPVCIACDALEAHQDANGRERPLLAPKYVYVNPQHRQGTTCSCHHCGCG